MTFDRERHLAWEELISASLVGDLTDAERRQLDAHLDSCADCRATLAAFADQRRIMSGLRHVAPPRDLGARVRAGVERDRRGRTPWWKRPPAIFAGVSGGLAVVAGALLALVLLDAPAQDPQVGQPSITPQPSVSAAATAEITPAPAETPAETQAVPTLPPPQTPAPTGGETTPPASEAPIPTEPPSTASPEPDAFLAVTGPPDNQALTIRDAETSEPVAEPAAPPDAPVAAELSPDGQWVAYLTVGTGSGLSEIRATRIGDALGAGGQEASGPDPVESSVEVGETVLIGASVADSAFLERMSWSSDGRFLAVTLADPATEEADADVWILDVTDGGVHRLTDSGAAFAGSFVPSVDETPRLWVSIAAERPLSWTVALPVDEEISVVDPATDGEHEVEAFQPLVSPNGAFVIAWAGVMTVGEDPNWLLSEGGQPILAEHRLDDPEVFPNARPLFGDLVVDRDGFSDAAIAWSPNSDAYAVWNARWTGIPQGEDGYPDPNRVYLGRATDPRGLTRVHAIDAGDLPEEATVVDVKLSPTGRHLAVTARRALGGDLDVPTADLLLVTRNTGDVADEVQVLGDGDDGWFGPAVFDETAWETLIER